MMITYGYLEQIAVALLCLPFFIRVIRRKAGAVKIAAACVLWVYAVAAVGVFFFPIAYSLSRYNNMILNLNLIPFHSIIEYCRHLSIGTAALQILGNIAAFLPIGFLVPILSKKFRFARNILILSLLLSVGIETVQLIESLAVHYPTKSVDIDDVILNFIGGTLGYLLFRAARAVWESRHNARMPGSGEV